MCKEGINVMQMVSTSDDRKRLSELEQMKLSLELQLKEMSAQMKIQQEKIESAQRDVLTGLRNRAGIAEEVNRILVQKKYGTFCIIDMDNFKQVNDTYGHLEGDRVLKRFAHLLTECVGEDDLIARIGGDEFILFFPQKYTRDELRNKASKIVRYIEKNLVRPNKLIRTTISMGLSVAPTDGITFEMMYTNADKALYHVKRNGKAAFSLYEEVQKSSEAKAKQKFTMKEITTKLRENRMEGSFVVEYDSFEKIYRFLERNIAREQKEVQCVLFTVNDIEGQEFEDIELQRQMEHLQHAVASALRKGDVTTTYSSCQILVLLMDVNTFNAQRVVERILHRFEDETGMDAFHITSEIQQLLPEERE